MRAPLLVLAAIFVVACGTSSPSPTTGSGSGGVDAGTGSGGLDAGGPGSGNLPDGGNPPPVKRALNMRVTGSGTVHGAPADCRNDCQQQLDAGQAVHLVATADTGWKFDGWQGDCSGVGACDLSMTADHSVSAVFTQIPPPPPPPSECDGLMPASLPPPMVAKLPQNACLDGTSDDGNGNFALGYDAGGGPMFPNYLFFTIRNGQAVRIGDTIPGGDESGTYVYSQPSGFTAFLVSGRDGGSRIYSYDHDGRLVSSQTLAPGAFPSSLQPTSAIGVDPSGGTATLRHVYDATSGWMTIYKRLDKAGAVEIADVVVDRSTMSVAAIGVALSGHSLAVVIAGSDLFQARWLAKDGTPISDWFTFQGQGFAAVRFLMDGSVLVGFHNGWQTVDYGRVSWSHRIQDARAAVDPVPDWVAQRPGSVFWVIRNGRGYALVNSSQCGADHAEILAASGKSCGCMNVPNARGNAWVGRDGSLMVSKSPSYGTCAYDLYPQLLK
jgi:hypothetical protein